MTQAARRESTVGEISTLLGQGSEFEGKLTFEGTVRIDGVLKGEVFSDDVLIIGEGARVEAEIDIGEIIIQGRVTGNIRAKRSIETTRRSFSESSSSREAQVALFTASALCAWSRPSFPRLAVWLPATTRTRQCTTHVQASSVRPA